MGNLKLNINIITLKINGKSKIFKIVMYTYWKKIEI